MSDSELAVVAPRTFQTPILIERAGPSTRKKFFEFFTGPDPKREHTSRLLPGNPTVFGLGGARRVSDSDRRLFLAEIDRVDSDRRPDELRRINYLRFWEETSDDNPRRFGLPVPHPSWENHQSFYTQVAVLGRQMANQLRHWEKSLPPMALAKTSFGLGSATLSTAGCSSKLERILYRQL